MSISVYLFLLFFVNFYYSFFQNEYLWHLFNFILYESFLEIFYVQFYACIFCYKFVFFLFFTVLKIIDSMILIIQKYLLCKFLKEIYKKFYTGLGNHVQSLPILTERISKGFLYLSQMRYNMKNWYENI